MARPSIEDDICAQHVLEAGFLWLLRDKYVRDPAFDLSRLADLDERVEANLDGLRLAEERGWQHAAAALDGGEAGEMFTATVLAVGRADMDAVAAVLDATGGDTELMRGVAAGFGWSALAEVREILPALFDSDSPPALHWLGVAACAVHREDAGPALSIAAGSEDIRLRRRAFRAAGQLGRIDMLPALVGELQAPDEELRYAAAWSATLLGNPSGAEVLSTFAKRGDTRAEEAADVVVRALPHASAMALVQTLTRDASSHRAAIRAAMALGDPALVPWLLDAAADAKLARQAAWAITTVLGVDLIEQRARRGAPRGAAAMPSDAPDDERVAMDADESLEWPDPPSLTRVWERERARFRRGTRYFLGGEPTPDRLRAALSSGRQPHRRAAALELAIRSPGRPLAQTSAPAFRLRGEP